MQIQYVGGPIYCLALLGFKVALLTSYLRIAGVVKLYRKVIVGAIVVCVINQLVFAVIISVSCIPVSSLFLLDRCDLTVLGCKAVGLIDRGKMYRYNSILLCPGGYKYRVGPRHHCPATTSALETTTSFEAEDHSRGTLCTRILCDHNPNYSNLHGQGFEDVH
jgi:hypothetical protein